VFHVAQLKIKGSILDFSIEGKAAHFYLKPIAEQNSMNSFLHLLQISFLESIKGSFLFLLDIVHVLIGILEGELPTKKVG